MSYTLHVVSLPHTELTEKDLTCAYSMKVLKFCGMMKDAGCKVILYGPDKSEARCDEHVVITTAADRERWGFGHEGFDTVLTPFLWDSNQPYWFEANTRAIDAIQQRLPDERSNDFLCLIAGWAQQPIAAAITPNYRNPLTIEWGVGYEGIFVDFCAFESYAWMHHVYGIQKIVNGRAYDNVIPNFFDITQFEPRKKDDYLLYIGRVVTRKGPHIAAQIAERVGMPLKVAGPGVTFYQPRKKGQRGKIIASEISLEGDVEYMGKVGIEERAELMARARAVIVPTLYVEPFGGVAVEAMLSGTPVVASDWGSFTEIVTPEVGQRFRTLQQGADAVRAVADLKPADIRQHAVERFGLEPVGQMFMRWLDQLHGLWGVGWGA